ncbi:MAG TPA: biotin/lipoyl-containing protein, partial [Caldimonas sp.]
GAAVAATVTRVAARGVAVEVAGRRHVFNLVEQHATSLRFSCAGVVEGASFVRDREGLWLQHRGQSLRADDRTRTAPLRDSAIGADGKLRASMNGRVVAVLARAGDPVQAGAPLLTLEAMKMEHVHTAPRAGIVAAIHVAPGEQVAAGRVVAEVT